jgi:hypothetical protein
MNRPFHALAFTLIAHVCLLAPTQAASAESFGDTGERYYRQGNYAAAVSALKWQIQQSPNDAKAHYLLANSLMQIGQQGDARQQYQLTMTLTKDAQILSNCRIALNRAAAAQGAYTQQQGFQNAAAMQMPATPRARAASTAIQQIDDQVARTSNTLANDGSQDAASWQRTGQYMASQMQTNANNTASAMSRASYHGAPIYSPTDIQNYQQQAQIQSQQTLTDAQDKANRSIQYTNAKVWETQAAAQNLQELLTEPPLPGSAKLKAEGTNLYVRNFEVDVNVGAPMAAQAKSLTTHVPLKAAPGSLPPFKATSGGGKNASGNQNGAEVESTVHGQVLP